MGAGASVIGGMNIVLGGDGATFSQSIEQAQKQLNKLKGMTGDFASVSKRNFDAAGQSAGKMGHSTITSVQAASGALRELNGDITNNIRAVERFITTIPGVGNALKAIYPVVGAIAVAGMFYEGIKKANEFIKTVNEMPVVIRRGFGELHDAANAANDAMAVSIDRMEMEIAKLEHKPENALRLEIDETTSSVHKMSAELGAAILKADELLKKNKVGFFGKLMGKQGTEQVSKIVTDANNAVAGINSSYDETYDAAKNDGATEQNLKDIQEMRASKIQDVHMKANAKLTPLLHDYQQLNDMHQAGKYGGVDTSENLAIGYGSQRMWADEDRAIGQAMLEQSEKSKLLPLQAGKSNEEAQKKADEVRYRAMEVALGKQKELGSLSVGYEYRYWKDRIDAFRAGSSQYAQIEARVAALAVEAAKASGVKIKQFNEERKRSSAELGAEQFAASRSVAEVQKLVDFGNERHENSVAELNAVLAESAVRTREQVIGFDLARGALTRHDAAVQLATLHAAAYQLELQKLDQAGRNDGANGSLTPDERRQRQDQREVQRAHLMSQYAATSYSDQQAIGATTVLGATTSALEDFIAATKDSASQIKNFTGSSLSAFNDQVVKSLTTRDHQNNLEFRNLGAGIFRSAAGAGLTKLEGSVLSSFGLGGGKKPTGAAGDALHVVVDNAFSGLGTSALSALFGGGGAGAANAVKSLASGGGAVDTIGSVLTDMIPFMATGGPLSAGTMAVVGENGPELFMPQTSGSVIPNHKIGSYAGASGGGDMHFNIDARGSNDPAAVRMQVQRGIMAATPGIVRGTLMMQRDQARRRPSTRRS